MNETFNEMLSYIRGIWRRRWYCVFVAWAVCVAGWVWVAQVPDTYLSSARIYVDTQSMLGPLMRGLAVETNIYAQIDIMQRTLLSRPNLAKVVRMTDLDLTVQDAAGMEALLDSLRKNIKIDVQGTNLYSVSFESTDRELAKRVVQSLITIFVESNLGASRTDLDKTRRFVEDQIAIYEIQLDEAEERRAEFLRKNMLLLPGQGGYYRRMEEARSEVAVTEAALAEAVSRRNSLAQQLAEVSEFLELGPSASAYGPGGRFGPPSDVEVRILDLEQRLDNLLLLYTTKHPDVVATERRLAALRQELDDQNSMFGEGMGEDGSPGSAEDVVKTPNPLYAKIKLALVEEEATIATLRNRIELQLRKVTEWEGLAKTVPIVESELSRLDRDYQVIKRNYEELLSRREATKMAQEMETKADKIQFRVIDPPRLPIAPSGPNRLLFITMVMLSGLAAGIASGFLLSQIDESIPSTTRLRETFPYPVLGTVSMIFTAADRRRRLIEVSGFATACLMLGGAYGGLLAMEFFADLVIL